MNHFTKNHTPWIAWGLLIIVLVSIPGKELPVLSDSLDHFQPDKLIHVLLFLVLVFLMLRGFDDPPAGHITPENLYFFILLSGIMLGGATEIYQHFFIPGRTASLKDFLFNTLGCVIGWLVYSFRRIRIHSR